MSLRIRYRKELLSILWKKVPTYGLDVLRVDVELFQLGAGLVYAGHHRAEHLQGVLLHPALLRMSGLG
jgi:hypothetical protein